MKKDYYEEVVDESNIRKNHSQFVEYYVRENLIDYKNKRRGD
jgi:hypothetical protein